MPLSPTGVTMKAAELFVRCLENEDVDYIFGIPGEDRDFNRPDDAKGKVGCGARVFAGMRKSGWWLQWRGAGRVAKAQCVLMLGCVTRMCGWAPKSQCVRCWVEKRFTGQAPSAPSVVELRGQRLIEHEVRARLYPRRIELRRLIEQEISLGRPARRREGWGKMVQVEVQEDSRDDGWVGKKGEDPHLAPAARTEERKHAPRRDHSRSERGARPSEFERSWRVSAVGRRVNHREPGSRWLPRSAQAGRRVYRSLRPQHGASRSVQGRRGSDACAGGVAE